MKVEYSKAFVKAVKKQSGKILDSIRQTIQDIKESENIDVLTNCEKLIGYKNIYRVRIGNLRAFFFLRLEIEEDTVVFEYLIPRGQAYNKKIQDNLKKIDK